MLTQSFRSCISCGLLMIALLIPWSASASGKTDDKSLDTAVTDENRFAVGVGISYLFAAAPPGGVDDFTGKHDALFNLQATYFFRWWSLSLELGLAANQLSYEYSYQQQGDDVQEQRRYQNYFLNPVIVGYPIGRMKVVSPYMGAVLGLQLMVETGLNEDYLGQSNRTSYMLMPGPILGILCFPRSRVGMFADVRWMYSFPKYVRETIDQVGPDGNITTETDNHFAPFIFGLGVQVLL